MAWKMSCVEGVLRAEGRERKKQEIYLMNLCEWMTDPEKGGILKSQTLFRATGSCVET